MRFKSFIISFIAFAFATTFFIECRSKASVQPKTETPQSVTDKLASPSEARNGDYLNDVPKKVIKVYEYVLKMINRWQAMSEEDFSEQRKEIAQIK